MKQNTKYEDAMHELEQIVGKMESEELDIDTLGVQLKRAHELIKMCRDKLTKADEKIKKLLDEGKE